MTDRELLELAAAAAGLNVSWWVERASFLDKSTLEMWNPLTDDGDALRLAVKLHINLYINQAVRVDYYIKGVPTAPLYEAIEPDPYAATRRAIVRAAASMGKAMP